MSFWGDKPTTTSSTSMGMYPEWMKKDMLEAQDAYKKLYERNLDVGYRPYTGMTTAGFTPEQIASHQGLASLVGSQAPLQQEALGLTRGLTSEFTPEQAQKYMSPYLRASLDAQKAAAQRQFEGTKLPQFEAEAVAAGGMSGLGSRAGVQAAELQSGQNRLLADLEATGQQKAYQDAQNLFKSQKEREKQSALAMQTLNKEIFSGGIKEQALLDAIGGEKQQMVQSMLDEAQGKYWEKEEFGRNELNKWYQSLLGNPIWKQPNYQTTGTQAGGGPGMGKTLGSLAATGIGAYLGGGGTFGGMFSDERMKTDVQKLPEKDKETGLPLYAFRYKGDPKSYPKVMGPMAQEVEKKYPESIREMGGRKMIKAAGGGGLASTFQAYPYMNYMRRNMGGQVVPPVVYRQEGGNWKQHIDSAEGGEPAVETAEPIPGYMANPRTALDIPDVIKKDMPFQSITGDIVGTEEALAKREKDPTMKVDVSPVGKELSAEARVRNWTTGNVTQIARIEEQRILADRDASAAEIAGIRKETNAFQKRQEERFTKYQNMVKQLVGDDPNAKQKFWFTVAAAIGKPGGNVATNMAEGFRQATLNADADRKEKNKLLMQIAKDEIDFMKDVDTLGFTTEVKLLGLTKAQQKEVNALDSNIRKRFMEEMKIHGDYLLAMSKAKGTSKDKSFGSLIKQGEGQIGKEYGFMVDEEGNLGAGLAGSPTLDNPLYQQMLKRQAQFRKLYTDKLKELGSTSYKAQLKAYDYATANTDPKTDISNSSGDTPVETFSTMKDANRVVQKNKEKYLNESILIGKAKFKVTTGGFVRVQ
jgi:hypothetical protein